MNDEIEKAIKTLSGKAESAQHSTESLHFSQAVLNLANAKAALSGK